MQDRFLTHQYRKASLVAWVPTQRLHRVWVIAYCSICLIDIVNSDVLGERGRCG
jgi:hypothetical protein